MTHEAEVINRKHIYWIQGVYGKMSPITANCGYKHDYLGMILAFTKRDKVEVKMQYYIQELWSNEHGAFSGKAAGPAARNLFDVKQATKKLNELCARKFQILVAKTGLLSNCERPDVQLTVGFLSTCVCVFYEKG